MSRYNDYKSLMVAFHKGWCDQGECLESLLCMGLTGDEIRDFHIAFKDEVNEIKARLKLGGE